MKQKDVVVGMVYLANVGGSRKPVKVVQEREASYSKRTVFVVAKCDEDGSNVGPALPKFRSASAMHPMPFTFHVIVSSERTILAVYGSALRDMAEEQERKLNAEVGPVRLFTVQSVNRPYVGGVL